MKNIFLIFTLFLLCPLSASDINDYRQAKRLYKQGQYEQAFSIFQAFSESSELKPYANYYLLRSGVLAKKHSELKDFDFSIASNNNQPFASEINILKMAISLFNGSQLSDDQLIRCAEYFQSVGNYSNADKFLQAIKDRRSFADKYYYTRAAVSFGQGNLQDARRFINRIKYSAKKFSKMAIYFRNKKKYYQKLVKDFPHDPASQEGAYFLFKQARRDKKFDLALKYLNVLEKHGSAFYRSLAQFEKGYVYYRLKKFNFALQNFRKITSGYYKPYALFWESRTQEKLNNPAAAKELLLSLIERYPFSYYSYRASKIIGVVPNIQLNEHRYNNKKARNLPDRLQDLIKASAYDDAFYEVNTFYSDQDPIWYTTAERLLKKNQYFYVIKLNKPLKDKFLGYPLAYQNIVEKEAKKYGLDPLLVLSIIREESHFKNDAVSWSNANGLMQLMKATAAEVARKLRIKNYDLTEPEDNIKLGAFYLDYLIKRFGTIKGVMAYNGGPGNLSRNDTDENIDEFIENFPLSETRRYVKKVMSSYWTYQLLYNNI